MSKVPPQPVPPRVWQRMLSGRRLDIVDPSPFDVEIEDIALGLSRQARWNGQTIGPHGFSVAQHCLLVVDLLAAERKQAPRGLLLAGLLHDAAEYVTSDLISPFKRAVGDAYRRVEDKVEQAVHLRFGLPAVLPDDWRAAIKKADRASGLAEAVELAGFSESDARKVFGHRGKIPHLGLVPWDAEEARRRFLERFRDLAVPPPEMRHDGKEAD